MAQLYFEVGEVTQQDARHLGVHIPLAEALRVIDQLAPGDGAVANGLTRVVEQVEHPEV